jgi:hypothetical protein
MGRVVASVQVSNPVHPGRAIRCDVLGDTGTTELILPTAWKNRLGPLTALRRVTMERADQRIVEGEGPVQIQIEGFAPIFDEVIFLDLQPSDGAYEPVLGYVVLEKSRAAVDLVGHRLVPVKHLDLKRCGGAARSPVAW